MVFDQLSRGELLHLMDLASRCLTATTPDQLESIISSIYELSSFRKAALGVLVPNETGVALAHFVNHSYGSQWADLYASQNFQRVDPILVRAASTEGAFQWDEAVPTLLPAPPALPEGGASIVDPVARDGSATFVEAAQAYGLVSGVSFGCAGIASSSPFRSVLSVVGVPSNEVERTLRILNTIGPHLHESYRRVLDLRPDRGTVLDPGARGPAGLVAPGAIAPLALPEPVAPGSQGGIAIATQQPAEISVREREVLCWAQQGKTYWEIGSILGITERTVKFHVARIKQKLDVVSTAHAIAKAMRTGLIT